MFQTIDEYAEAELESQGEAQAARRAHAEWVIALIEVDAPRLSGPDQVELLDRFETEHDNIRAALNYAIEQEDDCGNRHADDQHE